MITDIEDYFSSGCGRCDRFETADCSTRIWAAGLHELRRICLDMGLEETVKWGHPCYRHAGRNIVLINALRSDFRLSFFNSALLTDPEKLLTRAGPNSQNADLIRFEDKAHLLGLEPVLRAYIAEAKAFAEAGTMPVKMQADFELPEELTDALDADPELAEAFNALTPGRQRGYVIHLTSAKNASTRIARIAKFRSKVLEGKGFNER